MTTETTTSSENLMTPDELKIWREEMAAKKQDTQRKSLLKEMLEKDELRDVYSELYKNGGLKDMVDKDPSILDNKTLFIKAAGLCKESYRRQQDEERAKREAEEKAHSTVNPPADPNPVSTTATGQASKTFDPSGMDVFNEEYLKGLPPKSAKRAFFEAMKPRNTEKWRKNK